MPQGRSQFNLMDIADMKFALRQSCRLLLALLPLAAPLLHPADARAETIVHKTVAYFTIGGRTAADLDRELQRNGPKLKSTGNRHPGATRIRFGGDVTYSQTGNRCRVSHARVTVSTRILLPRWKYRKNASPKLGLLWDTLSGDIRRHEERHAEIARGHARDMEAKLSRLPAQTSCAAMQRLVSRVSQDKIEDHDRDQARFDHAEAASFENRMIRLLKARMQAQGLD